MMSDQYTMCDGSSVSSSVLNAQINQAIHDQKPGENTQHRYIAIELKKPRNGQSEFK